MGWTTPVDRSTNYVVLATDYNATGQDDLAFLFGDAGWTNVASFTNSWASTSNISFILLGRVVYLRGAFTTAGTANTAAFTLPVGYRPSVACYITCAVSGGGTTNNIFIATTGVVTPFASSLANLNLSFPTV